MEEGEIKIITREGQVAMDFSGETGKVITDMKEIQQLANTRNKVVRLKILILFSNRAFVFGIK